MSKNKKGKGQGGRTVAADVREITERARRNAKKGRHPKKGGK
jgi:hypothetical protein